MNHMPKTTCPACASGEACSRSSSQAQSDLGELKLRLETTGCFERAPVHYAARSVLVTLAIAGGYCALLAQPPIGATLAIVALIALASVQAAFIAHEIGDGALTRSKRWSRRINQFLMTFLTGTSSTYFDFVHHLHHQVVLKGPKTKGDRDFVRNPYEIHALKRLFARDGTVFMLATLLLRAVTFRLESLKFLAKNPRSSRLDRAMLALHYLVWLVLPAVVVGPERAAAVYLAIALVAGPYIGVVLTINHEGMSRAEQLAALPVIERVVASTRNLGSSRLNDVVFGGVNNHIEHHLFPEITAARLPAARRVAQKFLTERGYAYTETSAASAIREAVRHFRAMPARQRVDEALS